MMKNKSMILYLFIILFIIGIVRAVTVSNESPAANSWDTDGNAGFNFSCIGNASNGEWGASLNESWSLYPDWNVNLTNSTGIDNVSGGGLFYVDNIPNGEWQWFVTCWNDTAEEMGSSAPRVIKIDTVSPQVIVERPANATFGGETYITTSTVRFNATCIDVNPDTMYLDLDDIENTSVLYENVTSKDFNIELADGAHSWNVRCNDDAGNVGSNETNSTFIVDTLSPSLTLDNPTNGSWDIDGNVAFTFGYDEANPDTCELWGNFTNEGSIGYYLNQTNSSMTNGTQTFFDELNLSSLSSTPTGFNFEIICNDTIGRKVSIGNNTVRIDIVDPDIPSLVYPYNSSTGSDYLPNLSWMGVPDFNFDRYTIFFDNDSDFSSPSTLEVTSNETTNIEFSTSLDADTLFYWKVNVTALSGRGSENDTNIYTTDSICHTLKAGYNYCGIERDAAAEWDGSYTAGGISLDQIQIETDASYIYYYNSSSSVAGTGFVTYQNGTTPNRYYNLTTNDVVLLYRSTAGIWPINGGEYAGRVWSSNQTVSSPSWDYNFTNLTEGGYNLYSVRYQEGQTMNNLSVAMDNQNNTANGTSLYFTYINNSGIGETCSGSRACGQFVPYRYNWTINNAIKAKYGEVMWIWVNASYAGDSAYYNTNCWNDC